MRIPLPRAVPLLVVACGLLASCNQPYAAGRLAPKGLPEITDREPDRPQPAGDSTATPSSAHLLAKLSRVPPARVTESEVHDYVLNLNAQHGRPGLAALEPGESLVERLRFCTSRVILDRTNEVLPELKRLAVEHADNPLVWRQLGWAHSWAGEPEHAERCMRKAYALAKLDGFKTCPHLPSFFGKSLLLAKATREEGIKLLRDELANGTDGTRACWTLAEDFSAREQHVDALACLDAALARTPNDEKLTIAKAKVLVEIHKPDEVIALLVPILRRPSPDRYAVETMMHARVLRREFADALALLDLLLTRSDLTPNERKGLQMSRADLAEAKRVGQRTLLPPWEAMAVLRGHPEMEVRRSMLRNVVGQKNLELRRHALHIAFNGDSPALRAEALILLIPQSTNPLVNVRAGLKDENGSVRATAAILASRAENDRDKLAELVLEFMAKESDAYAFRQMHTALGKLTGATVALPVGAAEDPKQRAGIVAQWIQADQGRKGK